MQLKFIREKRNSKQIPEDLLRENVVTLIGYYTRQFNFCRSTSQFFFFLAASQSLPFLSPFTHPFCSPLHHTFYLPVEMRSRILRPFFITLLFDSQKEAGIEDDVSHSHNWQNPSKIDPKFDFAQRPSQTRRRMLGSMQIEYLALWNSKGTKSDKLCERESENGSTIPNSNTPLKSYQAWRRNFSISCIGIALRRKDFRDLDIYHQNLF